MFDEETIEAMRKEGEYFENYMKKEIGRTKDKEKEAQRMTSITICACNRCSKRLTRDYMKSKQCRNIADKLYCKECISEMYRDGTMSRILKSQNGKNGRNQSNQSV